MTIQPEQLHYSPSHEWVAVSEEDGQQVATIGISAFAVEQLTDLVFMALPVVGKSIKAGEEFGEVESVKAVSPLYSPVSGQVLEVHDALANQLEILGQDPYTRGWMLKIKMSDPSELNQLLDFDAYQKQCSQSG